MKTNGFAAALCAAAVAPDNICHPAPGKLELLDLMRMPLAPKRNQDVRQPTPEDPDPLHAGMAAGTERHQWVWSPRRRW